MDKPQFVEGLGRILAHTNFGISGARYDKTVWDESAVIEFYERPPLIVNINGDSNAMIILDVMKALEAHIGF